MGDSAVFKDIFITAQSAKCSDRKRVFQHLGQIAENDIPHHTLKLICRLLQITVTRYSDSKSSRLVSNFVKDLVGKQPGSIVHLVKLIADIAGVHKNIYATKPIARVCLNCLNWSCYVCTAALDQSKISVSEFESLLESQAFFLHVISGLQNKTLNQSAYKMLTFLWKQGDALLREYETHLKNLKENVYTLILKSYFLKFLVDTKQRDALARNKTQLLELFVKIIIGSKCKPPGHVLVSCQPMLKQVTHEEFSTILMTSLQKALLRNPELILSSVSFVIQSVTLDLSQYALTIGKNIGSHLHSKEEQCRGEAIVVCKHLAEQCSSAQAVEELVVHFFGVLNGSEGQLTVTTQRMGVLSGIGNLSYNTVSGSSTVQNLCELVVNYFITVLKHEVHEGTIKHTLSMLSLWCSKLTTSVPNVLLQWFKTAFELKTSTSTVRNAYMQCMNAAFHGNTLQCALPFIPLMLKVAEKAISQPVQIPIATEGLSAFCILLQICHLDLDLENKIKSILQNEVEKLPFLCEKFLSSVDDTALLFVMFMTEKIILDHGHIVQPKMSIFNRAILFVLTKPSFKIRQQASSTLRRMLSAVGGCELACSILKELPAFYERTKIKSSNDTQEVAESDNTSETKPHDLSACIITLCSGANLEPSEALRICIEALLPSHLPAIYEFQPNLWIKILTKLGFDPKDFAKNNFQEILNLIFEESSSLHVYNALKTSVKLQPGVIASGVIDYCVASLSTDEWALITNEEYRIFSAPEGELYDKSVIENLKEAAVVDRNIKRESKLYSYKEQMEEIELKKELEAKKRAKGLIKEPELTKKQLEAKKLQLEKESAVRRKLQSLYSKFQCSIMLLEAIIDAEPTALGFHIKQLSPVLISLFTCPLCAVEAVELYVALASTVSEGLLSVWARPIAYISLRLMEPMCDLDPSWCEIQLEVAVEKIIERLHAATCQHSIYANYDMEEQYSDQKFKKDHHLCASGFAYCFPLMKQVLLLKTDNTTFVERILEIIMQHVDVIDLSEQSERKYQEYLPLKQMLDLLVKVICKTNGSHQELAILAFLKVCCSVDGGKNHTSATMVEIKVLLESLLLNNSAARLASLKGLDVLQLMIPRETQDNMFITHRIFFACFDTAEENRKTASNLWESLQLSRLPELSWLLLKDLTDKEVFVRTAAADALSSLLSDFPDYVAPVIQKLLEVYQDKLFLPPPVLDSIHRVVSTPPTDEWEVRCGIALALGKLASLLDQEKLSELMQFFVNDGLGDRNEEVRKDMLNAAVAVVDAHGKEGLSILLPIFEDFMDQAPNSSSYDNVRQSVVILMGTLARHLDKNDPRVKPIIGKLIEALSTPSQQVQEAVANCLPPLIHAIKDEAPKLVNTLLQLLLHSKNYGERKGAAYGLAGLVKGLGILSLKQLNIMNTLTTAIQDKKSPSQREGALFAFEMLCNMLGRLFEPYVVNFLPHLLNCFGDNDPNIRMATDVTAKAVMGKLSAHGVKLVLPSLIRALEEDSWRTKAGSIELLGAMAFCAPKQLSSCLPSIVPKLIEVLSDSHRRVQDAGAQALRHIGSVIRNPEIQALVNVLLNALQDPAGKTSDCLARLLDTRFVHFIDAPSLALIMPVIQRAFQDRSTETRKMSAQIIGNMYSLTDQKDLAPYLPSVIPGLKQSLLDPVPEVRSVSARALGAMVKGMGEDCFEDLMPWLMMTLTSESSSVDRSGAAQGLSEVVGGLGVEKLKTFMPEIIVTAERNDIAPHVKDGYIMMFIYLPMVFKKDFIPYIGNIINPILKALADENEYVRDTALRAGQRIVNMYADTAIMLLLPELERGLFDDNWRIRYSSVQLLGDLLYKISGVSGKMTTETADEDDNFGTEQSNKLILGSLGFDRRNRVLAGLYMGRSDVALMVRQAALHVWKVVVTNTPRTLREILPTLFSLLLGCLASNSYDKRQVAARTLGDLVRKLGERVLPEIIPILEKGLDSDRPDQRQGVCIGLSEIMASTSREMVLTFVDSLVPTVRRALCDPLPEVRQAAAITFDSLHSTVGVRALDDILPYLLRLLSDPKQSDYTLDGLRQVMAIKSKVVLPYLVPQLTAPPVNTKALSFLSAVAGEALTKHLSKILPALLSALTSAFDTPEEQQELQYCQSVVLAVTDDLGVRTIIDSLLEASRSEVATSRRAAVALLFAYCCQSKIDISQHVPQLLRGLIRLFTDNDPKVLQLSWEALNAVTKTLNAAEQLKLVPDVRQAVRFAASDLKGQKLLPGFCLQKGITPILPIFREAILNGTVENKEEAARGLGEVIRLTSADALKPSVIHITGPLIRILGDRFNWTTKVAILETLALLLAKVGPILKPFLPQLQTTFMRCLSDSHRLVRLRSADALSHLIVVHSRCDALFTDLYNAMKTAEDNSLKETMLHALRCITVPAGDKMADNIRRNIMFSVSGMLNHPDDACRTVAAACLGTLCKSFPQDELVDVVREYILDDDPSLEWMYRHGRSIALMIALKEAPERLLNKDWTDRIVKTLLSYITADRLPISSTGVRACGYYMLHQLRTEETVTQLLLSTFAKNMNHPMNEMKQTVALTVNFLARHHTLPQYVMKTIVPNLVNGTKEKNSMVKSNSEYALVTLLQLRNGDATCQICLNVLDAGAKEALADVIAKVLKKVASQPEPKEEDLDDTQLT